MRGNRSKLARYSSHNVRPASLLSGGINGRASDVLAAEAASRSEFANVAAPHGLTLNQTVEILGWRSERVDGRQGKRVYCAAGHDLGVMTAHQLWEELRSRGLCTEPRGYELDVPHEPRRCPCTEGK